VSATARRRALGQSLWLDNISRELLDNGALARDIAQLSITGLTANPSTFHHAIAHGSRYDDSIRAKRKMGRAAEMLFFELALEDLTRAAHLLLPAHHGSDGEDGWVSLEISPELIGEPAQSLEAAWTLFRAAALPNLMIKIPGVPDNLPAIEDAIFAGIPVHVTLLFCREQYLAAATAYRRGIERRIHAGLDPDVRSVASLFVSRWDRFVAGREPAGLAQRLGLAVAAHTYKAYRELLLAPAWTTLAARGARPQRLLWDGAGAPSPAVPATYYVQALAAPLTIITLPEPTLLAFAAENAAPAPMPADGGSSGQVLEAFARSGVDVARLGAQLQLAGTDSFVADWNALLRCIESKAARAGRAG